MPAVIQLDIKGNAEPGLKRLEEQARKTADAVNRIDPGNNNFDASQFDKLNQSIETLGDRLTKAEFKGQVFKQAMEESSDAGKGLFGSIGSVTAGGLKFVSWAVSAYIAMRRFNTINSSVVQGLEANRTQQASTTDQLRELMTAYARVNDVALEHKPPTKELTEFNNLLGKDSVSALRNFADAFGSIKTATGSATDAIDDYFDAAQQLEEIDTIIKRANKQWGANQRQLNAAKKDYKEVGLDVKAMSNEQKELTSRLNKLRSVQKGLQADFKKTGGSSIGFKDDLKETKKETIELAELLHNPPASSQKLPTSLRITRKDFVLTGKAADDFGDELSKTAHQTGKAARSNALFSKSTLTMAGGVAAATGGFIAFSAAASIGATAIAGVAAGVAGLTLGTKKWLETLPEIERYNDLLASAQLNTAMLARDTTGLASELRHASGFAITTSDALHQLSKTNIDLGFDDQVKLMKFASLQAKRIGEDVATTNTQILEAMKSGSAETLHELGLLPGGIDAVAAQFDSLNETIGLFDKLTDAERKAVIQTEALANVASKTQLLEDAGFKSASAMDVLHGTLGDVRDSWLRTVRDVEIGGKTSVEWFQVMADTIEQRLRPFIASIPEHIQQIVDGVHLWGTSTLESINFMVKPLQFVADIQNRIADALDRINERFSRLVKFIPILPSMADGMRALADANAAAADKLAKFKDGSTAALAIQQSLARANRLLAKSRDDAAKATALQIKEEELLAQASGRSHKTQLLASQSLKGGSTSKAPSAADFGGSDSGLQGRLAGLKELVFEFENGAARAAELAGKSIEEVLGRSTAGLNKLHLQRQALEAEAEKDAAKNTKKREQIHKDVADALAEQLEHINAIEHSGRRAAERVKAEEAARKRLNKLLEEQIDAEKKQAEDRQSQLKLIEKQEQKITDLVSERLKIEEERNKVLDDRISKLLTAKQLQKPVRTGFSDGGGAMGDAQPTTSKKNPFDTGFGFAGGFFKGGIGFDPMAQGMKVGQQVAGANRFQTPQRVADAVGGGADPQSKFEQLIDSINSRDIEQRVVAERIKNVKKSFAEMRKAILDEAKNGKVSPDGSVTKRFTPAETQRRLADVDDQEKAAVNNARRGRHLIGERTQEVKDQFAQQRAALENDPKLSDRQRSRELTKLGRQERGAIRQAKKQAVREGQQGSPDEVANATDQLATEMINEAAKRSGVAQKTTAALQKGVKVQIKQQAELDKHDQELDKINQLLDAMINNTSRRARGATKSL